MQVHLISVPRQHFSLPGDMVAVEVRLDHVDWSRDVAAIVDLGEQRTGGYAVIVLGTDVDENQGRVVLRVQVRRPGGFALQVLTRPHAVALVPRGALSGRVTVHVLDDQGQVLAVTEAEVVP